ncbi:hypothetical protein YQE_07774, partial [Dendroctonus ponderosae]
MALDWLIAVPLAGVVEPEPDGEPAVQSNGRDFRAPNLLVYAAGDTRTAHGAFGAYGAHPMAQQRPGVEAHLVRVLDQSGGAALSAQYRPSESHIQRRRPDGLQQHGQHLHLAVGGDAQLLRMRQSGAVQRQASAGTGRRHVLFGGAVCRQVRRRAARACHRWQQGVGGECAGDTALQRVRLPHRLRSAAVGRCCAGQSRPVRCDRVRRLFVLR